MAGLSQAASGQARGGGATDFGSYDWTVVKPNTPPGPSSWAARAGLQAVELRNSVFVMGGRTPLEPLALPGLPFPIPLSIIWQDVWRSDDRGATWAQVTPSAGWPARAYFQAVTKGGEMFVLGGQNFKAGPGAGCAPGQPSCSDFFNDVWSSRDGTDWKQLTPHAGWETRAGLSAIVHRGQIYVLGGSQNDDASTVPGAPPSRKYFNDVWKSKDGRTLDAGRRACALDGARGGRSRREERLDLPARRRGGLHVRRPDEAVPAVLQRRLALA